MSSNIVAANSIGGFNQSYIYVWEYKGETKAPGKFEFPIDILKEDAWGSYQVSALGVLMAFRDYSVNFFLNIKKSKAKRSTFSPNRLNFRPIFIQSMMCSIL